MANVFRPVILVTLLSSLTSFPGHDRHRQTDDFSNLCIISPRRGSLSPSQSSVDPKEKDNETFATSVVTAGRSGRHVCVRRDPEGCPS